MTTAIGQSKLIRNFMEEAGRDKPLFYKDTVSYPWRQNNNRWDRPRDTKRFLSVIDNVLSVTETDGSVLPLARFIGKREDLHDNNGAMLLNGDGFSVREHTWLQTSIRNAATKSLGTRSVFVVPFLALFGAGLDLDSLLPIANERDRMVNANRYLNVDPRTLKRRDNAYLRNNNRDRSWNAEMISEDTRFSVFLTHASSNPTFQFRNNNRDNWTPVRFDKTGAFIRERRHFLGGSVFSGIGPDGNRHDWISSFDENEATALYFLAQLPDNTGVKTVATAVAALAPPIVHQARLDGKRVERQGDIFFIETNITNAQMKKGATIHARGLVFENGRRGQTPNDLATDEQKSGIMIYNTGHTASHVAVKPNGVTFVTGTVYHDPELETTGRTREHANLVLSKKWFLAIRNMVPKA